PPVATASSPPPVSTLSLHDALPISFDQLQFLGAVELERVEAQGAVGLDLRDDVGGPVAADPAVGLHAIAHAPAQQLVDRHPQRLDRKSTRLNSSHVKISYAVFCLKK